MSVIDLAACVQGEQESTAAWVRRVAEILHSSNGINPSTAIVTLENNCRFKSLKLKLGRLKRDCNDMGTLMSALVKYGDSDNTKYPKSEGDKTGKASKSGKPVPVNPVTSSFLGKRKAENSSDFVANTQAQGGLQVNPQGSTLQTGGGNPGWEQDLDQPCLKHSGRGRIARHTIRECIPFMKAGNGRFNPPSRPPNGGSGPGFYGPGYQGNNSGSGYRGNNGGYQSRPGGQNSQGNY